MKKGVKIKYKFLVIQFIYFFKKIELLLNIYFKLYNRILKRFKRNKSINKMAQIDENSFSYKSVVFLQKLLSFRQEELNKSPDSKNELSAFIDADLKRHTVIHSLSIEPQKKKYYLEALQVLKSKVEINPSSTEISYLIAKEYANMSSLYNPKFGNLYADSAKKAEPMQKKIADLQKQKEKVSKMATK